jgi:hypothetical protein
MATVGGRLKELESHLGFSASAVPIYFIGMAEEGEDNSALACIELDGKVWNQAEGESEQAFKERVADDALSHTKLLGASVLPIFLILEKQGQNKEKTPSDSAQTYR